MIEQIETWLPVPALVGAFLGIIAGAFVTPPFPRKPIEGDVVWLLMFAVLGGVAGAIHGILRKL
jgi:hypothetical protein